jgi:tripartite-type tricarboxylate transporter receptor subunit TctC
MLIIKLRKTASMALISGAMALAMNSAAQADPVADFYSGRTVTVVAPSGTGGSIYLYALLVSNQIGKHIPGQPNVVVESRTGGGGISGANYVNQIAPKDGTVIGELHPSSLLAPSFERTTATTQYNPTEFQWLGSVVARTYVGAAWHDVPVNSLEEMRNTPVRFGANGRGSGSYQNPKFMAHVTGAQLEIFTGYSSGGETNLAIERGEVQGRGNYYTGFLATNPDWIRDNKLKFLFKMGPDHADLADVQAATDIVAASGNEEYVRMLKLLEAPLNVGQGFYVANEVPADRAKALRGAFEAMVQDPEFLAQAETFGLEISPVSADAISDIMEDLASTPAGLANRLDQIISD